MIDHEDLDGVSAEALVAAGVGGVVNAARSISGRYPNLGPIRLLEAGIPLVDTVGPLLLGKVREGDQLRLDGDRIYAGSAWSASGSDRARRRSADRWGSAAQAGRALRIVRAEHRGLHAARARSPVRRVRAPGARARSRAPPRAGRGPWLQLQGGPRRAPPVHPGRAAGPARRRRRRRRPDRGGLHARPDPRRHGQRLRRGALVRRNRSDGGGSGGGSRRSWSCTPTRTGRLPAGSGSRRWVCRSVSSRRRGPARTPRSCSPTRRAPRRSSRWAATGTSASSSTRDARGCRARSWSGCASARS